MLTVIYFVTMSLGAEAYSRFRVPFLPLYAMLAGGGAAALARSGPAFSACRRMMVAVGSSVRFFTIAIVSHPSGVARCRCRQYGNPVRRRRVQLGPIPS